VSRLTCGHIQHMYSWWWVRLSPETCRVQPLRSIKTQLLHLVGLISLLMIVLSTTQHKICPLRSLSNLSNTNIKRFSAQLRWVQRVSNFYFILIFFHTICNNNFNTGNNIHCLWRRGLYLMHFLFCVNCVTSWWWP